MGTALIIAYGTSFLASFVLYYGVENSRRIFPLVWVWALMFMLNGYGLIYYNVSTVSFLPLGVKYDNYVDGAFINWIFVSVWSISYLVGSYYPLKLNTKKTERKTTIRRSTVWLIKTLIVASILGNFVFYSLQIPYGYTVFNYKSLPLYEVFGIIASFRSLLIPSVGAYLIISPSIRKRNLVSGSAVFSDKILWTIVGIQAILGITLDMQRGDILYPMLAVFIIILARGYLIKVTNIAKYLIVIGIPLMVVSPLLDQLRRPAVHSKNISYTSIMRAVSEIENRSAHYSSLLSTVTYEPYRKSILPASTALLRREAKKNGYVYFSTYDSVVLDMVPRFIWEEKPWPLSVSDDRLGTSSSVAARNAGQANQVWTIGGGSMYWQLGWLGVVVGGTIVGLVWGNLAYRVFTYNNVYAIIVFLSLMSWGLNFVTSIDSFALDLMRLLRVLFPLWLSDIILHANMKRSNV